MDGTSQKIHKTLKAIKENDGFPGPLDSQIRANILGRWATVEVSPLTGMDMQWTLTPEGKKYLRQLNGLARGNKKPKKVSGRWSRGSYTPEAVVPLTIEVLDALKAIRETGDPNTNKMDILARIQRYGSHAAKTTKDVNGGYLVEHGALAIHKDGVWSLTTAGRRIEAGHIRKSECAQFSGKVR